MFLFNKFYCFFFLYHYCWTSLDLSNDNSVQTSWISSTMFIAGRTYIIYVRPPAVFTNKGGHNWSKGKCYVIILPKIFISRNKYVEIFIVEQKKIKIHVRLFLFSYFCWMKYWWSFMKTYYDIYLRIDTNIISKG